MSDELSQILTKLRTVLQMEAHEHCVAVEVLINAEGYEINYKLRSPGSLNRDGISMRNINGEFI